jgi:putative oxidoreductase
VKYSNLVGLFGRQLFSIIFILSSASHFKPATVEYGAQHGVPLASVLVPLSGIVALAGGLSVLLGYRTRLGAWLLTLFLIPVTLTMHNFWVAPDARAFQVESALFLRNVALLGGALLIGHFGGGPLSLDALLHREKEVIGPIRTPSFAAAGRPSQTASEGAAPVPQRIRGSRS